MTARTARSREVWRIGVIGGTGRYARRRCLPALAALPEVRLVALHGRDPGRLREVGAEHGVPKLYTDPEALIADPDVDAVLITAPNHLHHPLTLAAFERSKHVLCEKPLAVTLAEAIEMEELRRRTGLVGMTGFRFRFMPAAIHLKALVDAGEIGRVQHARLWCWQDWAADGCEYLANPSMRWRLQRRLAGAGVLGDIGAHLFDIACWWFGDPIEIAGRTAQMGRTRAPLGGEPIGVDNDDWFAAWALFQDRENGVRVTFEASRVAPGVGIEMGMAVSGTKGCIRVTASEPTTMYVAVGGGRYEARPAPGTEVDLAFIRGFVAMLNGEAEHPSFADGVRVQAMIEAVEDSHRRSAPVQLTPLA
ncbi:MAG TPA: Gfo/Idh/MocA family oxidoreductase [Limnochordia bacterium]